MPKSEKKLKVMVKSHYSHETRKDVNLSGLKSLKLEDAWPFMREEIEKEIGNCRLVCVPFITEADLYKASSLFIKSKDEVNWNQYKALGELTNIIDEARTDPTYIKMLKKGDFEDKEFKFPHESVKITLQDDENKNKVRVILINFQRAVFPVKDSSKKIFISKEKCPELKVTDSIYLITNVLMARTVEFRVTTGSSSRIFHIGNPTPLVFGFEQFKINKDGELISELRTNNVDTDHFEDFTAKKPVEIPSKSMEWSKIYPSDRLWSSSASQRQTASVI